MARTKDPKKYDSVMRCLQRYIFENGYPPAFDEIQTGAGLSSKCLVEPYLTELARDGLIHFVPKMARTIRLTEKGRSYPLPPQPRAAGYINKAARINAAVVRKTIQLPVVGRTFAGLTTPIPNGDFTILDDTIEVDEDALPPRARRDHFFVLEVSGDSMIEAGIFDGDYVICRKSETAQNNEMVVALLTDRNETTLKYFHRENGYIRLQPANHTMEPILIYDPSDLIIQGVVVQVVNCR